MTATCVKGTFVYILARAVSLLWRSSFRERAIQSCLLFCVHLIVLISHFGLNLSQHKRAEQTKGHQMDMRDGVCYRNAIDQFDLNLLTKNKTVALIIFTGLLGLLRSNWLLTNFCSLFISTVLFSQGLEVRMKQDILHVFGVYNKAGIFANERKLPNHQSKCAFFFVLLFLIFTAWLKRRYHSVMFPLLLEPGRQ